MEWTEVAEKLGKSVLRVEVSKAVFEAKRPYRPPLDVKSSGSCFIYDVLEGLVMTNAHVVKGALAVSLYSPVRLGDRELYADVFSICPEKDVAILQMDRESVSALTEGLEDPTVLNVEFGDSLKVMPSDSIMAIGYPLTNEIKFTIGGVSGFHSQERTRSYVHKEDSYIRSPTYIQLTADLNPGNSGGIAANKEGKVVGINSAGLAHAQGIGFAIGSRVPLALLDEMYRGGKGQRTRIPTLALKWNPCTDAMIERLSYAGTKGVYISKVLPDSILKGSVEKGDILTHVCFMDPFWTNNGLDLTYDEGTPMCCYFDQYGDITPYLQSNTNDFLGPTPPETAKKAINRSLTISELIDVLVVGKDVAFQVVRRRKPMVFIVNNSYRETVRIPHLLPTMEPFRWTVFAGLCCVQLTWNVLKENGDLVTTILDYDAVDKRVYEPHVMVVQIFPRTTAQKFKVIREGDVLRTINGVSVSTVEEVESVLAKREAFVEIETINGSLFVVSREDAERETVATRELFSIDAS